VGTEWVEAIRSVGPIGAVLAALATILAATVRLLAKVLNDVVTGELVPRKSVDELIATYERIAAEAIEREQWSRGKLHIEERISEKSLDIAARRVPGSPDLTADLATRRRLIDSARDVERGAKDHD
jgi:hypothetical protein